MKSYSGKGIFDASLARERRRSNANFNPCPAYEVTMEDGRTYWQSDKSIEQCLRLGTTRIKTFEGSAEDWFDGKPETIWHIGTGNVTDIKAALQYLEAKK